ncbi:hypothetical protein BJF93_08060 [Xaviernesmea oryzae]|uniref:Uncharacterized protein n=1 Tax=Xaviernesmea oryzae TaxID=464029 RepID=A0A1Q9B0R9_9HYPH|nr:hypothetical protein BJF93_08060 [Xaviernesmea oryzae]
MERRTPRSRMLRMFTLTNSERNVRKIGLPGDFAVDDINPSETKKPPDLDRKRLAIHRFCGETIQVFQL